MNDTRTAILRAGMDLWRQGNETDVSARKIAGMIGLTHAGVLYGFKNAAAMRDAVARAAVAAGDPVIIPKLIVAGHAAVGDMSPVDRQRWLAGC